MSFGPTNYRQGGTRGGADQFKWEDVKNDKYRENYLGHSVQAPVGRWQKGKDLTWYAKLSKDDRATALQEEIALAKQRDQDLMDQALGIAPKKRAEPTGQLDAAEMKELLNRGGLDRAGLDGERVEGLGAAPIPQEFATKPKKTLAQKYEDDLAAGRTQQDIYALRGSAAVLGADASTDLHSGKKEEKAMKKAMKKLKKKEKKAKKAKKKEKKRERHAHMREDDEEEARDRKETRGRSQERRDQSRERRRSVSSSASSRSPSRSRSRSPRRRVDQRSPSRSVNRDRHSRREYGARFRPRSRSKSRSRGRRQPRSRSRSRSVEDRKYRDRRSPPRRRGRADSRDRSPSPRGRY